MSRRKIPLIPPVSGLSCTGCDEIVTDPFGSYTGLVENPDEKPVQDADDL